MNFVMKDKTQPCSVLCEYQPITMLLSKYTLRVLAIGLSFGLIASCAKHQEADTTITNDTTLTGTTTDHPMATDTSDHSQINATSGNMDYAAMNDGNILSWMGMADSLEIAMANMAKTKAQHADVRKFAQMMITEHALMQKEGQALARKQNIAPIAPSRQMVTYDMMSQNSTLEKATGNAFDSIYIGSQIAMHQHVLDNLGNVKPQNGELKAAIEKAKPHVQHHLDEARRIQSAIRSK